MFKVMEGVMFIENFRGVLAAQNVSKEEYDAHLKANPATIFKLQRERNAKLAKDIKGKEGDLPKMPKGDPPKPP